MEQKYGEFVGVDNLYIAPVIADTADEYTTGAPEELAPVANIAQAPEIASKTTYYNNVAANTYVTEGKTEVKIVISNLFAQKLAEILGKSYNAAKGIVWDGGQANPPLYALGFRYNMGTNGYRYYWYYVGTFGGGSEDAASKTNDVDVKTYELTYTAVTTAKKFTVDGKQTVLKRTFADTSDAAFDPTGWFDQVQTPDNSGAPDAVALSSIVPADNDSAIAVGDNIVLTFNNKIVSEAITVIKADGTLVACAKSWDSTGKILTINPTENLAAASTYIVAVNGVVDIFGQALAASASNFATA
jgi:phi13 family phage major tail protein